MSADGKQPSVATLVQQFVENWSGGEVDQPALDDLRREIASQRKGWPPSQARVRDALLATDIPVSRSIGGFDVSLRGRVRIRDLDSSEASLIQMASEYEQAKASGDALRAADCRRAVIHSKKHLGFLLARPNLSDEKREEKTELNEWFRVWLEAPPLFESWVNLRRRNSAK